MLAIVHYAIGAAGGTLLNEKLGRGRLLVPVVSGICAMIPDVNKLTNTRAADVLHDTILSNLFWFHGVLDSLETGHPELEGVVALLILLSVTVFVSRARDGRSS